ncbi:MAG: hypothetical protein JNK67_20245 [Alphaproteobacteria bacterium]|nr:hypothetical protein [Alphaproteobacteria bacterium]
MSTVDSKRDVVNRAAIEREDVIASARIRAQGAVTFERRVLPWPPDGCGRESQLA